MGARKVIYLAAAAALVLALAGPVAAQNLFGGTQGDYVENLGGNGALNWSTRLMRVTGIGAPNPNLPRAAMRASAIDAARIMAMKNALECLKGVNIDSQTTVENYMTKSAVVVTKVQGVLRGARVVETHYFDDGSVEVVIEVPVDKKLADALLPPSEPFQTRAPAEPPAPPAPEPKDLNAPPPPPEPVTAEDVKGGGEKVVTGLVIDARELGLKPAMSPKVLDEAGNEVYGSAYVSREYAIDMGIVGYAKDLDKAKTNERVTNDPVVVKAVKVSGPKSADVVIPTEKAEELRKQAKDLSFMTKCRVMIVL